MDMRSRPSRPLFLLIPATVFALVVSASENKDVVEEQHYSQADQLWFKQVKAEYEDDAWDWYQQNAADPTAARKQRRTMPDSTAYQITWARVAMGIDEIMYAASGITPDFIVSSVELELIRSKFTDAMASPPFLSRSPDTGRARRSRRSTQPCGRSTTTCWASMRPFERGPRRRPPSICCGLSSR